MNATQYSCVARWIKWHTFIHMVLHCRCSSNYYNSSNLYSVSLLSPTEPHRHWQGNLNEHGVFLCGSYGYYLLLWHICFPCHLVAAWAAISDEATFTDREILVNIWYLDVMLWHICIPLHLVAARGQAHILCCEAHNPHNHMSLIIAPIVLSGRFVTND